jgi:hypothetical protein
LIEEDLSPISIMVVVGFELLVAASAALVFGIKVKGINANEALCKSASDFISDQNINNLIRTIEENKGITLSQDIKCEYFNLLKVNE